MWLLRAEGLVSQAVGGFWMYERTRTNTVWSAKCVRRTKKEQIRRRQPVRQIINQKEKKRRESPCMFLSAHQQ